MKNKLIRSRCYNSVLYPEDETHVKAMQFIKNNYDNAYILHNLDCDEFGEIKKEHWHVVIRFPNARSRKSVADELGIAENYLEKTTSLEASLLYLIHYGDTGKHQYSINEVGGNLITKLKRILSKGAKDEEDQVSAILDFINQPRIILISELISFCQANGYWSTLRRGGYLLRAAVSEHNDVMKKGAFYGD